MATTEQKHPEDAAKGPPPQSDEHMNTPGVTNGVPDEMGQGTATGAPDTSRHDTETAGGDTGG